LSFSGFPRGSFCDELWSQGACTAACMERKSEQAWTTTVKNTEAINVRATMEKPRFDMSVFRSVGTRSTVNTFRFKSSRLTVLLQTLFARFRNPQQLVTVFSARILLAHFARINLGAKCSIAPFISTANPRCVGKFPSLPLYKNEYVRLVLEDVGST
jgi:hypothetical protein